MRLLNCLFTWTIKTEPETEKKIITAKLLTTGRKHCHILLVHSLWNNNNDLKLFLSASIQSHGIKPRHEWILKSIKTVCLFVPFTSLLSSRSLIGGCFRECLNSLPLLSRLRWHCVVSIVSCLSARRQNLRCAYTSKRLDATTKQRKSRLSACIVHGEQQLCEQIMLCKYNVWLSLERERERLHGSRVEVKMRLSVRWTVSANSDWGHGQK